MHFIKLAPIYWSLAFRANVCSVLMFLFCRELWRSWYHLMIWLHIVCGAQVSRVCWFLRVCTKLFGKCWLNMCERCMYVYIWLVFFAKHNATAKDIQWYAVYFCDVALVNLLDCWTISLLLAWMAHFFRLFF